MARLNKDRQAELEPIRMEKAIESIQKLGYEIGNKCDSHFDFIHKGRTITYFPYSGWASGATINDGRGLKKLLSQLEKQV